MNRIGRLPADLLLLAGITDTAVARHATTAAAEARHEERRAIARELHDIVAHSVSVMVIQAAGARSVINADPDRAVTAIDVIQDISVQSTDELQRLLNLMRAADDGDPMTRNTARELHDNVAHSVSLIVRYAATARDTIATDPCRAADALDTIRSVGKQSMDELRRMPNLMGAGPDEEVCAISHPGLDGLDGLVAQYQAAGLIVEVEVENDPVQLDPSVGLAAYRLVQEALGNSRMHVGVAAQVAIRVVWAEDQVVVTVTDDGVLSATEFYPGYGLGGLDERLIAVGGELTAGPTAVGFMVKGVLPVARRRVDGRTAPGDE